MNLAKFLDKIKSLISKFNFFHKKYKDKIDDILDEEPEITPEPDKDVPEVPSDSPDDPQDTPDDPPNSNIDDWDNIHWVSENYSGAKYDFELSAKCDNSGVRFSYPSYSWPSKVVKVEVDAIACFFIWNNDRWEGGKFEWIREGGQSYKSHKNITKENYGGLYAPAPGTRVAWSWVSVDGKLRTNLAETVWV